MKKIILTFLLISGICFPQEKYLIYFKDKEIRQGQSLSKTSDVYRKALNLISERSLQRRMRVLPEDSLVTYEDLPVREDYKKSLIDKGIIIQRELRWFNAVSAFLSTDQLSLVNSLSFVSKTEKVKTMILREQPQVEDIQQGTLSKNSLIDTLSYGYSFRQLNLSDIPFVQSHGIHGEGVIIGLLDTGFDWKNHKALKDINILKEYDFVFGDSVTANQAGDASDQDNHGTYVFSIIGGYDPGHFLGAAYRASYLLAKTEDVRTGATEDKHYEEDNYAAALEWMESMGVDITSSSLGYNTFVAPEQSYTYSDMNGQTTIVTKAAEMAFRRGVVVITAAGNEGNGDWHYITAPADGINVIAVGALNSNNTVAAFSSRGPTSDGRIKPDIDAMGVSVYGALAHSKLDYGINSGTSAACPIAAGAAALLMSAYPHLKNYQVRGILLESSDNSASPDFDRGYGLISAQKAIEFPNLEYNGSHYIINKAILDPGRVQQNSLKLLYSVNNSAFSQVEMKQVKDAFYQAELPVLESGSVVSFYFEYKNAEGNTVRESYDKNYRFMYGYLSISRNINSNSSSSYPGDFTLSQNYPNPFNSFTRIDFKANAGERAELIIMNSIGQRIKYVVRTSEEGINSFVWDGRTDDGTACASGVYYYILRLSGKDYGNKMVLLK